MANHDIAHQLTHGMEGKEVNDPVDRGGHTIYGITKKVFKSYSKSYGWPGKFVDITPKKAKQIGKIMYWDKIRGDYFHSQCVADEVYDSAFHHGVRGGGKLLQRSINVFYHTPQYKGKKKLKVDGIIGDKTIAAINEITRRYEIQFYKCINGERYVKLKRFAWLFPKQMKYFIGWCMRA